MRKAREESRTRSYLVGLLGATALILAGCNGSEDSSPGEETLPDGNSPAAIAAASADNYDDNTYGLITGSTLASWIDDWESNRPAGITGKLVILQQGEGPEGFEYIQHDDTNVFTYAVDTDTWKQTRSNGVIQTVSMVPDGRVMDTLLSQYDIDPSEDMIVCAQGKNKMVMHSGRCWYAFRYWGTPKEHLAQLQGGNEWNGRAGGDLEDYFDADASADVWNLNAASVADLPEINFKLQATLEDMMAVVTDSDINDLNDGAFIFDARNPAEYDGTDFKAGAAQGHPNGALLLPYADMLVDDPNDQRFKSKAELEALMSGQTAGFTDATYQPVGAGQAYQPGDTVYTYCQTTYRAMVTGFATGAILGYPTRFYDGAMYEWHAMTNAVDSSGNELLPVYSPWRTDRNIYSFYQLQGDSALIDPRTIVNPDAETANAIILEDYAYKGYVEEDSTSTDSGSDDSGDGGSAPIPNAC
ncbi:MAG: rhodanese-like domain-containing protein [Pseudomonadota bacterium]